MKINRWFAWGALVSFFAYQFIMRVSPSVMVEDLISHFQIDTLQFSLLPTFYYLGYAPMQLPIGVLLDRYGPKIVAFVCVILCVAGTLLFTFAPYWWIALLGRFFIGMGSAAGFISTSKALQIWFPSHQFSRMVGISFTIGLIGAINSGRPISYLLNHFTWQQIMVVVCLIGILLGFIIFLKVPSFKNEESSKKSGLFEGLLQVFKMPKIIFLGCLAALMTAPLSVFADVWGVRFFMHVYQWTRDEASLATSCVYFGMCFGAPLLAMVSARFNALKEFIVLSGILMMITFSAVVFLPGLSWTMVAILLFIMGVFCCYQVLVFSLAAQMTAPAISGVVIGFTNMIITMAGIVFEPLVGYILHKSSLINQAHYSASTYQSAFIVILAALGIAVIGFVFFRSRETASQ